MIFRKFGYWWFTIKKRVFGPYRDYETALGVKQRTLNPPPRNKDIQSLV